jgi:hypothetical protein
MRVWIQRSALAAAFVLALAACSVDGGTPDNATTAAVATDSTTTTLESSSTTETAGGGDGTSTSTTPAASDPPPQIEGPAAPDFTFALADGSTFSLSDEQKPVYLVFWAEW